MKTKILKTLIIVQCILALSCVLKAQFPEFTKINTGAIHESTGHHVSSGWFDIDNDNDMDLIITNSSGYLYTNHPNLMYKNEGNGNFTQVKNTEYTLQILNVGLPGPFGDIDNDGDQDLMNADWDGTKSYLYLGDGYGNFEYLKTINQLSGAPIVLFDIDNDSFLDIVQFHEDGSRVYYNDGTGNFGNYESLNITCQDPIPVTHSIALGDADNDGDFDLYMGRTNIYGTSFKAKNEFFLNNGSGSFERQSNEAIIVQDLAMTPSINWIDYDNDGDMDLYVLNSFDPVPANSVSGSLFENKGALVFEKHFIEPAGYRDAHRVSSVWGDLDNDADLDLYITIEKNSFNGHASPVKHNLLLQNNGDGTFSEISAGTLAEESSHTATLEDCDNDGDLDVLLVRFSWANNGNNTLCMNEGNDNSWLILTLKGTESNSTAFGARIIAKATINGQQVMQTREITPMSGHATYNSTRVHFGLGDAESIDSIIIRWPSAHMDTFLNIPVNQFYHAIEDSVLEVDFRATNYIQYSPDIPLVEFSKPDTSSTIDLRKHFRLITGDTVPEISGDTMHYKISSIDNEDLITASLDGSLLTIEPASPEGTSRIHIIAFTDFTCRKETIIVKNRDGVPPEIFMVNTYLPDSVIVKSSEDGMVYLVPEGTDNRPVAIKFFAIVSMPVAANSPVTIMLDTIDLGVYWLYAADSNENISKHAEFTKEIPDEITIVKIMDTKIYPNPTNARIHIETGSLVEYNLDIRNINGQLVISDKKIGPKTEIDISSLPKGFYIITIKSGQFITSEKMIKL